MALLKDSIVTGDLQVTNNLYATTAQFQILKAPSTSGGVDYGLGTAGYVLKTGTSGVYWSALSSSDIPTLSITEKTSGTLTVARGGTGATTASDARANLGLGTMATETATNYLKLSGGTMTGPLKWSDNNALPERTSASYFLAIDAFASGGTTCWIGVNNVKSSLALTKSDVGLGNVANSTYAGGTAVTLNNSSKASSTASFYAPTDSGTADTQALVSKGTTSAPKWVDISPSITIGAGTSSAAPTINVTVLGRSGTAGSITTASTSVYGVTKLQDGISSDSTVLAATANAAYTASKNSLHTLANNTKFYITGCTSSATNTAGDNFDQGIYATTIAGELSAVRYSFNISGTEKAYMTFNITAQSIDFIFE